LFPLPWELALPADGYAHSTVMAYRNADAEPMRGRQACSVASSTSVDLMITRTIEPSRSPSRSADPRVIAETISWPLTSTTTSAMTVPSLTDLTVPCSWLRALSSISSSRIATAATSLPSLLCTGQTDEGRFLLLGELGQTACVEPRLPDHEVDR
jgi:hypothetical protein